MNIQNEMYLNNDFGELYLKSVNGLTFSRKSAEVIFKKQYGDSFFLERFFYIIHGSDSLLQVEYLLKHGVPKGSKYLFIEPYSVKKRLSDKMRELDLPDTIVVADEDEWLELLHAMDFKYYSLCGHYKSLQSIALAEGNPLYSKIYEKNLKSVTDLHFAISANVTAKKHLRQQMLNLPYNRKPINLIRNSAVGHCAVILAGGPSLDLVWEWLDKNRHRVIVIAVSRITHLLAERGVVPDFITSVDPFHYNYGDSSPMYHFAGQSVLVHADFLEHRLVAGWYGDRYFIGNRLAMVDNLLAMDNTNYTGPTVTSYAIATALELGCRTIILAGMDLLFSDDGRTHAQGSVEEVIGSLIHNTDTMGESYSGKLLESRSEYMMAGQHIQSVATNLKGKVKFFNISADALKLKNIRFQPIEKIDFHQPKKPFKIPSGIKSESPDAYLQRAIAYYSRQIKTCERMVDVLDHVAETDNLEQQLSSISSHTHEFMKRFNLGKLGEIELAEEEERQKLEIEIFHKGYEELLQLLEEGKTIAETLQNEQLETDVEHLCSIWKEVTAAPQHAYAWLETIKQKDILLADKAFSISCFKKLYDEKMAEDIESRITLKTDMKNSLNCASLVDRAKKYIEQGNAKGLNNLIAAISNFSPCQNEGNFIQALQLQHAGEYQQANAILVNMTELIEGDDLVLRVFNNYIADKAFLQAKEYLASRYKDNLYYYPFYARVLRIGGESLQAMDVLMEYIQAVPNDTEVLYEMGTLYKELGLIEGVEWIAGQMMNIDPENPMTEALLHG